jgi:hypothetical protein
VNKQDIKTESNILRNSNPKIALISLKVFVMSSISNLENYQRILKNFHALRKVDAAT